jgi:DNA-binding NarL/FixJ family response regulator
LGDTEWGYGGGGSVKAPEGDDDEGCPITVVLVDDEALTRVALTQVIEAAEGLELVGEAETGEAAVKMVLALRPHVVLIGLRLPGMPAIEAIEQLWLLAPRSRILVLTRSEQNLVVEAIVAGASGYMLKSATPDEIVRAVRATGAGDAVLSPKIAGRLLDVIRDHGMPIADSGEATAASIRAVLTSRELEIFSRLASGNSNQDIGRELSLSTNTVSNHIASILGKLQLDNRIQAAVEAVRSGIS